MKKNAFTLIEMVATIGLLGMLATIIISVSVRKINETKESARDSMIESIQLAAKKYVNENEVIEFSNYDNAYITLQTLVEKEYFTESLVDPTTKKNIPLTNEIYVTREENGTINSTYDINQRKNPKLTLIGSYNEYVEVGKEYIEQGVIAINTNKEDVSSSVVITGTVDTETPNTYKITYKLDNVKITRNVIVYSKNMSSEEILKASTYIERLYKTNNYQNDELSNPKVTYEGKEYDTGIRYVGDDPNNYVYFNCEPTDGTNAYGTENYDYASSCEVWRIIGVFEVKDENGDTAQRVKLINTNSTFQASWDSSDIGINEGRGINQWGTSGDYPGADLMQLLNGYYVDQNGRECKYNSKSEQSELSEICTKESLTAAKMKPLTSTAKIMIASVVWNTYATNTYAVPNAYLQEKGISKQYVGTSTCSSCDDGVERTASWVGLVGLMSVSDITYANGWLYKSEVIRWSISPRTHSTHLYYMWIGSSSSVSYAYSSKTYGVCPTVYLGYNVKIKSGNGLSTSPYILAI